MNSDKIFEVFQSDPRFSEVITFFDNKYLPGLRPHSAQDFKRMNDAWRIDFKEKLLCQEVFWVEFQYQFDNYLKIEDCLPLRKKDFLLKKLKSKEYKKKIALSMQKCSGISFVCKDGYEIDFIPIKYKKNQSKQIITCQIFILINALLLKDIEFNEAERDFQRSKIEQQVRYWYLNLEATKGIFLENQYRKIRLSSANEVSKYDTREFPSWMYSYSLSELLKIAVLTGSFVDGKEWDNWYIIINDNILSNSENGEKKQEQTEKSVVQKYNNNVNDLFYWIYWAPKDLITTSRGGNGIFLSIVKSLFYWCRWINILDDLEKENKNGISFVDIDDQKKKQNISTLKWVRNQRGDKNDIENIKNLEVRLKDLKSISIAHFAINKEREREKWLKKRLKKQAFSFLK